MRTLIGIFIALMGFSGIARASGGELGESLGANALAMGWTAVANPYDNGAVTVNPAMLSLERRYDLLAGASYGPHPNLGWSGALADSKTSEWLGLGVSYQRQKANPEMLSSELPGWVPENYVPSNERLAHDVTLAASTAVWDRRLSLGLNGTFTSYEHIRRGSGISGNMDVGLGVRPIRLLTLGLVGRNLLPVANDSGRIAAIAGGLWFADPEVGAIGFDLERKLEPVNNNKPWRLGTGLESGVGNSRFRAGYRWDGMTSNHWITGGLGAQNELGAVEYGIAVPLRRAMGDVVHQVSVRWSIPTELDGPP